MGPLIGGSMQPVLDLALIATMVAILVSVVKPLIALKLDRATTAYDSAVQMLTMVSAAGMIALATYSPQAFSVLSESIAVSAGAIGGYRVVKGSSSQPPAPQAPAATPEPTPDPAAAPVLTA